MAHRAGIEHDATDATAYEYRGAVYTALGYFDRAIADFQRCQAIDPAYELCRRHLSQIYLYLGRTDEALRLIEIGLENGYAYTDVVWVAAGAARGDRHGARRILAESSQDDPRGPDS